MCQVVCGQCEDSTQGDMTGRTRAQGPPPENKVGASVGCPTFEDRLWPQGNKAGAAGAVGEGGVAPAWARNIWAGVTPNSVQKAAMKAEAEL
mgnify:CR=1 FL=1